MRPDRWRALMLLDSRCFKYDIVDDVLRDIGR
jgi:hypothetical protein